MPIRPANETIRLILEKSVLADCRIWTGRVNHKGYGLISYLGKYRTVHRIIYEALVGEIPDGMHVLHRCDNPRCVNKEHLFLGTNRDNIDDKIRKDRSGKKLKTASVIEIKKMLAAGVSQPEIARRFGVHQCSISRIHLGQRWVHATSVGG